jgi:nitrous oxidase accessory protein NosD
LPNLIRSNNKYIFNNTSITDDAANIIIKELIDSSIYNNGYLSYSNKIQFNYFYYDNRLNKFTTAKTDFDEFEKRFNFC